MKTISVILLSAVCFCSLSAKSLEECSIVLWPKFDWIGSNVEAVAGDKLNAGDYIVYPGALGMKGWFRSDKYQINTKRIMLELANSTFDPGYYYQLEKHQEGIGGFFVNELGSEPRTQLGKSNRRRFYEYLNDNQQELVYCVDKALVDRPANLDFLGKQCDQLIIYYDRGLLLDPAATVAFFKLSCERARSFNGDIKILAGIELKLNDHNVDDIINLLEQLSDHIDGLLLVFEGTATQNSTAIQVVNRLRS